MDVAEWLRAHGFEQYEPAFRDNEIDTRVLPSLTAEDLKDLGVSLVGHRRRLLDAIAALGAAVRAGLAVIEAVGHLSGREDLSVRLGIATGLAVVGDLIGEGAAQERGVVGETPNLAARLQALAAPNTLVIGEATRRQVGGLFDLADLGPQALAGFAEPQPAWRVVGESGMLSRFQALRSGTTPLVGRDEEIELLLRRWQPAKSGERRVVLISGQPGIGKSRPTAAPSE